jgi:hypothetical protein
VWWKSFGNGHRIEPNQKGQKYYQNQQVAIAAIPRGSQQDMQSGLGNEREGDRGMTIRLKLHVTNEKNAVTHF